MFCAVVHTDNDCFEDSSAKLFVMYTFSFLDMNLLVAGVSLAITAHVIKATADDIPATCHTFHPAHIVPMRGKRYAPADDHFGPLRCLGDTDDHAACLRSLGTKALSPTVSKLGPYRRCNFLRLEDILATFVGHTTALTGKFVPRL